MFCYIVLCVFECDVVCVECVEEGRGGVDYVYEGVCVCVM